MQDLCVCEREGMLVFLEMQKDTWIYLMWSNYIPNIIFKKLFLSNILFFKTNETRISRDLSLLP